MVELELIFGPVLRTATTGLWFVQTNASGWRLYHYLDKPIE